MKLSFNIEYRTVFGEELTLNVIIDGNSDKVIKYRMSTADGVNWYCEVSKALHDGQTLDYYYAVERGGEEIRHEWTVAMHHLSMNVPDAKHWIIYDHWNDTPDNSYLYSSAYTDCISRHELEQMRQRRGGKVVVLRVRAPQLRAEERLAVSGDIPALGAWDTSKALIMTEHSHNEWVVAVNVDDVEEEEMSLKFFTVSRSKDYETMWENSDNRTIAIPKLAKGDVVAYELGEARFPVSDRRMAGTVIPIFSLRSSSSFGIGDFGDLKKMIDWVSATGQRVLQVLPINDTTISHTWTDSYPYNSISIYALHPQYVDLNDLNELADKKMMAQFEKLREELNALPQIDYERVNNAKMDYMRLLFEQEGEETLKSEPFKAFFAMNKDWLVPYAAFSHYRDLYGTATFSKWPEHREFTDKERIAMSNPRTKIYADVALWYFIQYHLDRQMRAAHEYARSKQVILKGDIPIGISRDGVEAWVEPRYFNLNGQAGAPPDAFSANGQNWGFPTYNWDTMIADGCQWWVRRFRKMQQYFDAYRIDHVLGFFRIWEIPIDAVYGLLGQFSPSLGMSRDEIESYGLMFQEELFTTPFIADWVVDRIFGENANRVREQYLERTHDDIYRLKEECNTQRKIEALFAGVTDQKELYLRDGLYSLVSDVLFVRDRKDADKFHPRIAVQHDFIYETLYDHDKQAFNRLYNDYYYRRNNQFWYHEAMKKLPRLAEATRMLICAEDLGMVPDCVAWVMQELRILSLEIQSMPKDPHLTFGYLPANPYRSVSTISTHDMPTLRQWWDEDWERTQNYYNNSLWRGGAAPHPLPGWLADDIVRAHLNSPSMLCLISLQDWMSVDEKLRLPDADAERINIPANPRHYWRYRMHMSIEELMKADDFNNKLKMLITQSGRK